MQMTNTEWLRSRILTKVLTDRVGHQTESLEDLRATEWSAEFEHLMRNRLLLGRFRYGRMDDPTKGDYDHVTNAIERLEAFRRTGNLEHLVDVANLCLIEFVCGTHPNRHLASGDDAPEGQRLRASKTEY